MAAAVRGCGTRVQGGVYAETRLSERGAPIESFLVDPPRVYDLAALGMTSIGVKLVMIEGVTHVLDMVGAAHYPNLADFVEELRRLGASRRLPGTLDFAALGSESKLYLFHPKAYISNHQDFYYAMDDVAPEGEVWYCPKDHLDHDAKAVSPEVPATCCLGLHWEAVGGGVPDLGMDKPRLVTREMPSFVYFANSLPEGFTPQYQPALFAILPITNLVVIKGEHGEHEESWRRATAAHLPILMETT